MHYVILSLFLYNVLINESFFTLIASFLFMLGLTFVLSLAPEALLTFSHMYAIDLCKNPQSCWICVQVLSMFKLSRIIWVKNFLTPLSSSCMQFVTTILPQERAQHDFSLPCIEAFWVHVPHLIVLNLFKPFTDHTHTWIDHRVTRRLRRIEGQTRLWPLRVYDRFCRLYLEL